MRDQRLDKMAAVLVHYSLSIKGGEEVLLQGEMGGLPLMEALYETLIKAGAHVHLRLMPPGWDEIFYAHASEDQLAHLSPFSMKEVEMADRRIRVIGPTNTRALSHVPSEKQAMVSRARGPVLKRVLERSAKGEMGWVVTLCPTAAGAQEANMGIHEYEDFVFGAAYVDAEDPVAKLKEIEAYHKRLIDYLTPKKELHFRTPQGTDLRVNVEGMTWINSCGKRNFPDGEVFTGPKAGGVEGVVRYTYPAIWQNVAVEDVTLHFEKGRVVKATASKNEAFLHAMLDQDEGARALGEIAIGTNRQIQTFTSNILFDEKIGGTFHAALGMGYPETGNTNQSSLHWDMICDLREGGTIHADGELLSENGVLKVS